MDYSVLAHLVKRVKNEVGTFYTHTQDRNIRVNISKIYYFCEKE